MAFLFRWVTTLFALVSLVLDARLAFGYGADETGFLVVMRTLLIEIEAYLAVVVVIMTVRIILQRSDREKRKPLPR